MTKTFVQILKEVWEEKRGYFENYKFYCRKIKKEAERRLGFVEVLVFGSIVKEKFTPQSDIDVLIISENLPESQEERGEIRTKIKSAIDPFSPFQIHLATPEEYQNWYQKFIKGDFEKI